MQYILLTDWYQQRLLLCVYSDHAHAVCLLVHVGVVHELPVSLAVGGVQGPVLHQQVDQARGRGAEQVPAKN